MEEVKDIQIKDIKETNVSWKITVRVIALWKSTNPNTKQPISLDMILTDKNGDKIHSRVKADDMDNYENRIQESKLYTIQGFTTWKVEGNYKILTGHKYQMFLKNFTELKPIMEEIPDIPKYNYTFVDFKKLSSYHDNGYCIDVIGRLEFWNEIEPRMSRENNSQIRDIKIRNERKELLKVTLWGELADEIQEAIEQTKIGQAIVIITAATVKHFHAFGYYLQSTNATQIKLNIGIPQVDSFMTRMEEIAPVDNNNVKTIEGILKYIKNDEGEMNEFICTARIVKVYHYYEWHYRACSVCKKKPLKRKDGTYDCKECDEIIEDTFEMYKLPMDINDDTNTIRVTGFGNQIKDLINEKVEDMIEASLEEDGKDKVASIFDLLIGKTTKFHIKVTAYNKRTKDLSSLSAFKIEPIPEIQKGKLKKKKVKKEKIYDDSDDEPLAKKQKKKKKKSTKVVEEIDD